MTITHAKNNKLPIKPQQGLLQTLLKKLGEWRPLGYFTVLLITFVGCYWLFVMQRGTLINYIKAGGYFPLPEESPRLAFFAIVGVFIRRLRLIFWDAEQRQDDLPIYLVRVMVECVCTPILTVILIFFLSTWHWIFEENDISLVTAGEVFTDILAIILGLFNPRLLALVYKLFMRIENLSE